MKRVRRIQSRLRLGGDSGHTLPELLTAMVILLVVLGGLTAMFTAGLRAEVRANRELQAQQNARAALDRMRHELHCADAVTAGGGAVSTVTVSLPATCPSPDTTVTYATANVGTNRWELTRAGDSGTAVQIADYLTSGTIFTYQAPAVGSLGRLSVDIPVNLNPADAGTLWRLPDDIVLRNTTRL
jgi:prepilin-type N-terminal cleavage/methylation domain-containing protein